MPSEHASGGAADFSVGGLVASKTILNGHFEVPGEIFWPTPESLLDALRAARRWPVPTAQCDYCRKPAEPHVYERACVPCTWVLVQARAWFGADAVEMLDAAELVEWAEVFRHGVGAEVAQEKLNAIRFLERYDMIEETSDREEEDSDE